jgi:hypothetical protein
MRFDVTADKEESLTALAERFLELYPDANPIDYFKAGFMAGRQPLEATRYFHVDCRGEVFWWKLHEL